MSDKAIEFAKAVRALRQRRSLNQRDIARFTARTQSRVSEVESGTHDPRLSTILDVVSAAGGEVMVIPNELVASVKLLLKPPAPKTDPGSVFDDVFVDIPRGEEDEESEMEVNRGFRP